MRYVFGIDLGGSSVKFGLFDVQGTLIEKWSVPTDTSNQGQNIVSDLTQEIRGKMKQHGFANDQIAGVGLGVPGAVTQMRYVAPCVNLNQWGGDVGTELSAALQLPVRIENDANVAALGEMWKGSAAGSKNVVFITLGTGVGGGVVVDGKIVSGAHGAGGEIGHITIYPQNGRLCGCGKYGCLEQYASATGLVNNAYEVLQNTDRPSALRNEKELNPKNIFAIANQGDALAREVLDTFYRTLGHALSIISCVSNPEVFVLGGGLSKEGEKLIQPIKKYFIQNAFPSAEQTDIRIAALENDAGIYGAAQLALAK